jgi:hypothetical protein
MLAPSHGITDLQEWLQHTHRYQHRTLKKSWISLVHLAWWTIWKESNARIFQNKAAPLNLIQARLIEEAELG